MENKLFTTVKSLLQRANGRNRDNLKMLRLFRSLNFNEKTIRWLIIDANGVSIPALSKEKNLNPTTLYRPMNKSHSDNEEAKKILADSVGLFISDLFQEDRNG